MNDEKPRDQHSPVEPNPYQSPIAGGMYDAKVQGQFQGASTQDERTWAMFCHLSTLAGWVIPFANLIGPLIIWLVKKDQYPMVQDQGKEALNFQINMTIYETVCLVLCLVLIGIPLLIAVTVFDVVMTIIAAMRASSGEWYRYPLTIRIIR